MADQIPDSAKSVTVTQADVTDADRAAVTAFHNIQIKRIIAGDKTLGDNRDVIEQAFARHRIEAEQRATRAAPPAMDREAVEKVARAMCADDGFDPDEHVIGGQAAGFEDFGPLWQAEERSEGQLGLTNYSRLARAALSTLSADAIRQGEGKYLVWSNEHRAWWGPDERGYTRIIERAGRYDRDKAFSISSKRGGGWQREENPDEIAIPEADAIAQYVGPRLATPAPAVDAVPADVFPATIGRVHLGERRSDGERLCSHGHPVPAGHPLYWPVQISQYDDSDPLCLTHAIDQLESDNADWGEDYEAIDAVPAGEINKRLDAWFAAEQIDESTSPQNGEDFPSWSTGYLTAIDLTRQRLASLSHGEGRK